MDLGGIEKGLTVVVTRKLSLLELKLVPHPKINQHVWRNKENTKIVQFCIAPGKFDTNSEVKNKKLNEIEIRIARQIIFH